MSTLYGFGAGSLFAVPGVVSPAVPTPNRFGALQQCGVDFSANTVNLFGGYQFPLASARGTVKIDGSGKFAQLAGQMLNSVFFAGSTMATGKTVLIDLEAGTIPSPSGPYTVTVAHTAGHSDLGVRFTSTGDPLTRVATVSAAGTYSVAAGVYTFHVDDAAKTVQISYTYTTTGGETLTMNNALMGVASAFTAVLMQSYDSQQHVLTLNKAIASKFTLQSALEDFAKPDFTFGAFSDSANVLGTWAFGDAA